MKSESQPVLMLSETVFDEHGCCAPPYTELSMSSVPLASWLLWFWSSPESRA